MPGEQGDLSDLEKTRISDWLQEKWTKQKDCPICGSTNWIIGNHLVQQQLLAAGGAVVPGIYVPYVAVFCGHCAYAVHFNAAIMNVTNMERRSVPHPNEGRKVPIVTSGVLHAE